MADRSPRFGWLPDLVDRAKFLSGRALSIPQREVRSSMPSGIARILFTAVGHFMVLVHGFIKKSQSMPQQDLELALRRVKKVQHGLRQIDTLAAAWTTFWRRMALWRRSLRGP